MVNEYTLYNAHKNINILLNISYNIIILLLLKYSRNDIFGHVKGFRELN